MPGSTPVFEGQGLSDVADVASGPWGAIPHLVPRVAIEKAREAVFRAMTNVRASIGTGGNSKAYESIECSVGICLSVFDMWLKTFDEYAFDNGGRYPTVVQILKDNSDLQFVEPHPTGGDCTITISAQKAMSWQRTVHGYPHGAEGDEQALDDFITVHWATVRKSSG